MNHLGAKLEDVYPFCARTGGRALYPNGHPLCNFYRPQPTQLLSRPAACDTNEASSGKRKRHREDCFETGHITLGDRTYASGEHAFHGEKYSYISMSCDKDKAHTQELLQYAKKFQITGAFNVLSGGEVKKKGGKRGLCLTREEVDIWTSGAASVQQQICREKFSNDPQVRECLGATGDKILVHSALRCRAEKLHARIWEGKALAGANGVVVRGGNLLGFIWMDIRDNRSDSDSNSSNSDIRL